MAIFTISYDLIKRKDYPSLWDTLKKHNAHRVLESVWLVSGNYTPDSVLKWLKSHVDNDDKLYVCETTREQLTFSNANAGTNKWLEANALAYA